MKIPTARKAASLTRDSKAMAATRPSWRSLASMWRVPKRMVKMASSRATTKAVSCQIGWVAAGSGMTMAGYSWRMVKLREIALSCRAM